MDGLECTRQLRANPDTRDIPIIIVSALARTEDILAGLEAGADEYLAKPIRGSELTLRVQSMARLHRERMDLLMSYEERGSQMRILTRLVEFCRAVSVCDHYEEVLKHSTAAVADVVNCRRVSIMVPDENEGVLRIASSLGLDEALARTLKVPPGRPIAGQVYATGQPIVVNHPEEFQDTIKNYESPFFASIPVVYVPLDAAGRVVGVLNATEKAGGVPFEARDLEYIELISKVTGTAIHDIRMREARDQASDSIVRALAKLAEYRDNNTGRHLERVTRFCLILAETLREKEKFRDQIDEDFLYRLERSVPLHDIGKVAIPDEILLFPGKLSPEQIAIMRTHAEVGANTIYSLIARAPDIGFLGMAAEIARHHHERYDGRGYPAGLCGDSIPLAARISSVADVYDALTTTRPYKEAYSHETAVKIIQDGRGTQFDPDVVEAFLLREKSFAELAEVMKDPAVPEERFVQEEPVLSAT
jgi:response regulator RpfG family c-di-GMP phosphodiesterase